MKLLKEGKREELTIQSEKKCLNCSERVYGFDHCSYCGQDTGTKRISIANLVSTGVNKILGFEIRMMKTFYELTVRPGAVITRYVEGQRRTYTNPIKYYFFCIASALFIYSVFSYAYTGTFGLNLEDDLLITTKFDVSNDKKLRRLVALSILLLQVATTLLLKIVYWRSTRNIGEITTFTIYLFANIFLLFGIIFTSIQLFMFEFSRMDIDLLLLITFLLLGILSFIYFIKASKLFFNTSRWKAFLKISVVFGLVFYLFAKVKIGYFMKIYELF